MNRFLKNSILSILLIGAFTQQPLALSTSISSNIKPAGDWRSYGSDESSSKYSKLNQINKNNWRNLKVAWRWTSPDLDKLKQNPNGLFVMFNEGTPLAVDGSLYVSTALSMVVKVNGSTGETIWKFDPHTYKNIAPPNLGFVHRGVSYWESADKKVKRIIYGTSDAYLYSLNADTGLPDESFGEQGKVDLLKSLKRDGSNWPDSLRRQYGVTSPPVICKDSIIIGSSNMDANPKMNGIPGDVRAFDVRTGVIRWRFNTIPQKYEFGNETWKNNSSSYSGNTNVWSLISADLKNGLAYLPVSTPTNDYYGELRHGDNLFAESLVCVDCLTGKRKWHFQFVHHGLWDYDTPAAPNIVDIEVSDEKSPGIKRKIPAVVQVTKQAFTYVFNRVTGEPIWPIVEKEVPQSAVPGEATSLTQPFPSRPAAFDEQGISASNILNFPDLKEQTLKILEQYVVGPLYTPPTDQKKGAITLPGMVGGASWAGAAYDPIRKLLFVTSVTRPYASLLERTNLNADGTQPEFQFTKSFFKSAITDEFGKDYKLPLTMPPYGRVTAIDLNKGEIKWQKPLGRGPEEVIAAAKGSFWEGKDLGWPRRSHLLMTPDLLFIGQMGFDYVVGAAPGLNAVYIGIKENMGEQNLKVFDPESGERIGEISLLGEAIHSPSSGNAYGAPMTFMDAKGKQYIIVPVGGANLPAEMVALALP